MPDTRRLQRRARNGKVAMFFELPAEMREGLREVAKAEDRHISYILRRAITNELARCRDDDKVGVG